MINKLMTYLLSIFYRLEKETPISIQAWRSQPSLTPRTEDYLIEQKLQLVKKTTKKPQSINKDRVTIQIKNNIYFLEILIIEMKVFAEYSKYVIKLKDMKEQSQGCLRILFKMKEESPYFAHTLKTVYYHTKTISQLLED